MHTFGHPCAIDEIQTICLEWKIPLIEDSAESLGSSFKNSHTGNFGILSAISFNGNKIITAGGGGAILTNDKELSDRARHITKTAKKPHPWAYIHSETGYNYRMPNLNAALLCAQFQKLNTYLSNKREIANTYKAWCASNRVTFISEPKDAHSNYYKCNTLNDKLEQQEFLEYANSQGVMCRPVWKPLHRLDMFSSCYRQPQTKTEYLEDRIVNIPSSVNL